MKIIKAGLDFDYESDKIPTTPDTSQYETCYVTSHKAPCRAAAFDHQGTVIATGSVDASIKILDIERFNKERIIFYIINFIFFYNDNI